MLIFFSKSNFLERNYEIKLSLLNLSLDGTINVFNPPVPSELSRRQCITRWRKRVWVIPLVSSSLSLMFVLDVCPWCLSLMFVLDVCPWCLSLLGPPQCLCPVLSTKVSLSPSGEGNFFHLHPLSAARPDGQIHRGQWVSIRGSSLTLFKEVSLRMGSPESFSGVWVFWFILPSCPSLSLDNLLYREGFPRSTHGVGMT